MGLHIEMLREDILRFLDTCARHRHDHPTTWTTQPAVASYLENLSQLQVVEFLARLDGVRELVQGNLDWLKEAANLRGAKVNSMLGLEPTCQVRLFPMLACQIDGAGGYAIRVANGCVVRLAVDCARELVEQNLVHELTHVAHLEIEAGNFVGPSSNSEAIEIRYNRPMTLAWSLLTEGLATCGTEALFPNRDILTPMGLEDAKRNRYQADVELLAQYRDALTCKDNNKLTDIKEHGLRGRNDKFEVYYVGWRVVKHLNEAQGLDFRDIAQISDEHSPEVVASCLNAFLSDQ